MTAGHPLQLVAAIEGSDLGLGAQDDIGRLLDAANQIAGHAFGETLPADEHMDALRCLREKDHGLSGRVSSAYNDHFRVTAELRFDVGCPVIDARTFKLR